MTAIAYNDANLVYPKKTTAVRGGLLVLETVRSGWLIYIPINVTVAGTFAVNIRTAALVAGAVAAANCPVISVFDNRSPGDGVTPWEMICPPTQLSGASPQAVTSSLNGSGGAGTLNPGNHLIMVVVDNIRNNAQDQWTTPTQAVEFAGATFNGTCTTVAAGAGWLPAHKAIFYGDSIMIGYAGGAPTAEKPAQDFEVDGANSAANIRETYAWYLCQNLGLMPIIDGFGGQGISKTGNAGTNVPAAFGGGAGIVAAGPPSWSNLQAGLGSVLTGGLYTDNLGAGDFIFCCQGQNDGALANFNPATNAQRQASMKAWWDAIHLGGPAATLVILPVLSNVAGAFLDKKTAAQSYVPNAAITGPTYYLDGVTAFVPLGARQPAVNVNDDSIDGIHLKYRAHAELAAIIQRELYKLQNPSGGPRLYVV